MVEDHENNQKGSYLKRNTIDKGISQKQIQDDLGVSQQYVSALLNGKKSIGKRIAKKLAELYDLNEVTLLFGEGFQGNNTKEDVNSTIKNKPHDEQMEILLNKIENLEQKLDIYQQRDSLYLKSIIAFLGIDQISTDEESKENKKSRTN